MSVCLVCLFWVALNDNQPQKIDSVSIFGYYSIAFKRIAHGNWIRVEYQTAFVLLVHLYSEYQVKHLIWLQYNFKALLGEFISNQ